MASILQVWLLACWLTVVACSSWQDEHYAQFQQQLQRIQQQPRQFGERNGYSHKFARGKEYQEPDNKQALFGELRQFGPPEGQGYSWDSFQQQQAGPWKDERGNTAVIPQQHVYSPTADVTFQDKLSRRDDFHQQSNSNQREYVPQHSNPLPHDWPVQDDFPRQEEMVRLGERVAWDQGEGRNRRQSLEHHGQPADGYFQYINVPAPKEYEFGFNRGERAPQADRIARKS